MPINSEHLASLTDANVIDQNGDKVGGVGQIYLDDATGQPAWASVKSGLFGLRESFVPLAAANVADGNIQVPYAKDFIKDAPHMDAENHLDDAQQARLYEYFGVDRSAVAGGPGADAGAPDRTAAFGSDETADDLYDGRTEGLSKPESEYDAEPARDGAVTSEYTTAGADDAPSATLVEDSGTDLGSGELTEGDVAPASVDTAGASSGDAAAIGAASAAGAGAAYVGGARAEGEAAQSADYSTDQGASYDADQSAAASAEEATDVDRSHYSADMPAAHSATYEGHERGAGYAASTETTAYEVPGAESGHPITDSTPPAAFPSDVEEPTDALTEPQQPSGVGDEAEADASHLPAGTDAGMDESGEPSDASDAGAGDSGDQDAFPAQGYRPYEGYQPDRDGTEMTDEERERLNEARGAL